MRRKKRAKKKRNVFTSNSQKKKMTDLKSLEIEIHESILRAIYYKYSEQTLSAEVCYEAECLAKLAVKTYLGEELEEEDGVEELCADMDSFIKED